MVLLAARSLGRRCALRHRYYSGCYLSSKSEGSRFGPAGDGGVRVPILERFAAALVYAIAIFQPYAGTILGGSSRTARAGCSLA
jgi:hypothetical protein